MEKKTKKENIKDKKNLLENEIFEREKEIEELEKKITHLEFWAVFEIKNGYVKLFSQKKEKYKINKNDYIIQGEGFTLVDKDKRDIRPYVRYLVANKKEKLRHNIILSIAVAIFYVIFLIFGLKSEISDLSKNWNFQKMEKTEKKEIKKENILNENLKKIIPNMEEPLPIGKGGK